MLYEAAMKQHTVERLKRLHRSKTDGKQKQSANRVLLENGH